MQQAGGKSCKKIFQGSACSNPVLGRSGNYKPEWTARLSSASVCPELQQAVTLRPCIYYRIYSFFMQARASWEKRAQETIGKPLAWPRAKKGFMPSGYGQVTGLDRHRVSTASSAHHYRAISSRACWLRAPSAQRSPSCCLRTQTHTRAACASARMQSFSQRRSWQQDPWELEAYSLLFDGTLPEASRPLYRGQPWDGTEATRTAQGLPVDSALPRAAWSCFLEQKHQLFCNVRPE